MKIMLDELSSIQSAHLVVTPERDTLRSVHNKLKFDFDEHTKECTCSTLKESFNDRRV
jgi:hypothetical protein